MSFRTKSAEMRSKVKNTESELLKELKSTGVKNVGNYLLGKTIGEGSFGKVKLGINKLTGQEVAIKIIDKIHAPAVIREVDTLRKLRHPNIAQLYEVLTTETKIYLVTEYASGGEIFEFIENHGPLGEYESKIIFYQLLQAIKYCHDKKFVHRDLKLENIMFDNFKNPKIIDFGFTREFDTRDKLLETYCGSTAYAAPEMIAGKKYSGPEADIWSLGIILYTFVCGYLPFDDEVEARIHSKILSLNYELPDSLSEECIDLIQNILQLDPKQRISIERMMEHPWVAEAKTICQQKPYGMKLPSLYLAESNKYTTNNTTTTLSPTPVKPSYRGDRMAIDTPEPSPSPRPSSKISKFKLLELQEFINGRDTDEKILLYHLSLLGYDVQSIIISLKEESCDTASGLFYLLLSKMRRNPLISSSAVLSVLSCPAMSAEDHMSVFNSLYQSSDESPSTETFSFPLLFNTGQSISLPSSWKLAINDRVISMVRLLLESSDFDQLRINGKDTTVDDFSEFARSGSQNFDESVSQYFGHLTKMTSSASILLNSNNQELTTPTSPTIKIFPTDFLSHEINLFGSSSPNMGNTFDKHIDNACKSEVNLYGKDMSEMNLEEIDKSMKASRSQESIIYNEESDITLEIPNVSRRKSAPDVNALSNGKFKSKFKGNSKQPKDSSEIGEISDMREFRERKNCRTHHATISEADEEDFERSQPMTPSNAITIHIDSHSSSDINSNKNSYSPFSRKVQKDGSSLKLRKIKSPLGSLNVKSLNELIRSTNIVSAGDAPEHSWLDTEYRTDTANSTLNEEEMRTSLANASIKNSALSLKNEKDGDDQEDI